MTDFTDRVRKILPRAAVWKDNERKQVTKGTERIYDLLCKTISYSLYDEISVVLPSKVHRRNMQFVQFLIHMIMV